MHLLLNLLTLLLAFGLALPAGAAPKKKPCPRRIVEVVNPDNFRPAFSFRGVTVSGHRLDLLVPNLLLTPEALTAMRTQNVLLVGEGYSDLLPYLLRHGVENVRAIDPVYALRGHVLRSPVSLDEFFDYLQRYRKNLSPMNVSDWPADFSSQDRVYSHLVVNNLDPESLDYHILEAARVLRPGGEAYLFGFPGDDLPGVLDEICRTTRAYRYETYEGSAYFMAPDTNFWERHPLQGVILRRFR